MSIWAVLNAAVLMTLGMIGILFLLWPHPVQQFQERLHQHPKSFQVGKLAIHVAPSAPPSASQLRRSGWIIVAITFIGLAMALAG